MRLTAPTYFNLQKTEKGTVLVTRGLIKEEIISEKFGNKQYLIHDLEDNKMKCLGGGSLVYIVEMHNLVNSGKEISITYDGTVAMESGKFAGKAAHQFIVDLVADTTENIKEPTEAMVDDTPVSANSLE